MASSIVRRASAGQLLEIGPTRNWIKLGGEDCGGRVGVVEMELGPGFAGPPEHQHRHIDHVWYLLAGRVDVVVDGRRAELVPGDFAFVPRGCAHSFANLGGKPARLLQVDTPRTLDGYFTELAAAFPAGTPVDPLLVTDIQRRHDTFPVAGSPAH
jgi:mannose-6-phosphate isomerase-like protein (cupin superfamily)